MTEDDTTTSSSLPVPQSPSLKRTSSSAGNSAPNTACKKPSSAKMHVYIVKEGSYPHEGEGGDEILAVYASLEDANNKVRVHLEQYEDPEDCEEGFNDDGCFWWSAADVGEGDAVKVYVEKWEVQESGPEVKAS